MLSGRQRRKPRNVTQRGWPPSSSPCPFHGEIRCAHLQLGIPFSRPSAYNSHFTAGDEDSSSYYFRLECPSAGCTLYPHPQLVFIVRYYDCAAFCCYFRGHYSWLQYDRRVLDHDFPKKNASFPASAQQQQPASNKCGLVLYFLIRYSMT